MTNSLSPKGLCAVKGCYMMAKMTDYCQSHYSLNKRYGVPESPIKQSSNAQLLGEPEYQILNNMKQRCNNPNATRYEYYGGKGIKVCERWSGEDGVRNFIEDMGRRPSSRHSIDRIDGNKHYEPSNCRWATVNQQAMNRSNNHDTPGVRPVKDGWKAQLRVGGIDVLNESFSDYSDAIKARKVAEEKYLSY